MPEIVCAAVFVTKSVLLAPVSADKAAEETVVVGALPGVTTMLSMRSGSNAGPSSLVIVKPVTPTQWSVTRRSPCGAKSTTVVSLVLIAVMRNFAPFM